MTAKAKSGSRTSVKRQPAEAAPAPTTHDEGPSKSAGTGRGRAKQAKPAKAGRHPATQPEAEPHHHTARHPEARPSAPRHRKAEPPARPSQAAPAPATAAAVEASPSKAQPRKPGRPAAGAAEAAGKAKAPSAARRSTARPAKGPHPEAATPRGAAKRGGPAGAASHTSQASPASPASQQAPLSRSELQQVAGEYDQAIQGYADYYQQQQALYGSGAGGGYAGYPYAAYGGNYAAPPTSEEQILQLEQAASDFHAALPYIRSLRGTEKSRYLASWRDYLTEMAGLGAELVDSLEKELSALAGPEWTD